MKISDSSWEKMATRADGMKGSFGRFGHHDWGPSVVHDRYE